MLESKLRVRETGATHPQLTVLRGLVTMDNATASNLDQSHFRHFHRFGPISFSFISLTLSIP